MNRTPITYTERGVIGGEQPLQAPQGPMVPPQNADGTQVDQSAPDAPAAPKGKAKRAPRPKATPKKAKKR